MSLYDTLTIAYPLPHYPDMQNRQFQTKDLDALMESYHITESGELRKTCATICNWTFVPMDEPENYTGTLEFYDFLQSDWNQDGLGPNPLVSFEATFEQGRLTALVYKGEW